MRGLRSGGAWNQEAFYAPIWLAFENGKEDACRDCHRRTQRISYKVKGNRGKESRHRSKASSACSSAMAREGHLPPRTRGSPEIVAWASLDIGGRDHSVANDMDASRKLLVVSFGLILC